MEDGKKKEKKKKNRSPGHQHNTREKFEKASSIFYSRLRAKYTHLIVGGILLTGCNTQLHGLNPHFLWHVCVLRTNTEL